MTNLKCLKYVGDYIVATIMGAMIYFFFLVIAVMSLQDIEETPTNSTLAITLLLSWGVVWLIAYPMGMFADVTAKKIGWKMKEKLDRIASIVGAVGAIVGVVIYLYLGFAQM